VKPLYIFDLDGTLALTEHRQHILDNKDDPQRWQRFFAACVNDQPNEPVIRTLNTLRAAGAECWIWSGRSDEVKAQTVEWLQRHGCMGSPRNVLWAWPFGAPERFRMRKAGDFTPDEDLKRGWLAEMEPPELARLTAVFDDRDKVVAMWRAAGVPCFQVAPGAF
jgi:hypothetical protein